jgi:phosphoribosylamine--glycine ligase
VLGLAQFPRDTARLFYANLRADADGRPVTSGGRVLHVVGAGRTLTEARAQAYRRIGGISFPGMRHRTDIGAAFDTGSPLPADAEPAVVETGR